MRGVSGEPMQYTIERGGLCLPQIDFADGTPPTEVTRFFRGIWVANTIVAGGERPSEVLPFDGQNGLQPIDGEIKDLVVPATDTQQAAQLSYELRPGSSLRCPMETHRVFVPPARVGRLVPLLTARCETGSTRTSREPIDVLRISHGLGSAVVRYQRSGEVLPADEANLPLVNQIMRSMRDFLAGHDAAVSQRRASH